MSTREELREGRDAVVHFEYLLQVGALDDRKDAEHVAALRRLLNFATALFRETEARESFPLAREQTNEPLTQPERARPGAAGTERAVVPEGGEQT